MKRPWTRPEGQREAHGHVSMLGPGACLPLQMAPPHSGGRADAGNTSGGIHLLSG